MYILQWNIKPCWASPSSLLHLLRQLTFPFSCLSYDFPGEAKISQVKNTFALTWCCSCFSFEVCKPLCLMYTIWCTVVHYLQLCGSCRTYKILNLLIARRDSTSPEVLLQLTRIIHNKHTPMSSAKRSKIYFSPIDSFSAGDGNIRTNLK